jgi:glc operon protein GlcG
MIHLRVRAAARSQFTPAPSPIAQLGWLAGAAVSFTAVDRESSCAETAATRGHRSGGGVMQRKAIAVACVITALATATGVAEQDVMSRKVLTLSAARKVVAAAEAEATALGVGVVVVVVDDAGHVVTLARMDSAQVASVNVGIGKARTAAIYRRPSRVFEEQIKNGRIAALALADATPLQGGLPILIDGQLVGAVGVSGDTPQVDEQIATAAVSVLHREPAAGK